ncbi:MAG: cytochrome c biogenesis protein CcsA [Pyrinomonadaceae bacterium]
MAQVITAESIGNVHSKPTWMHYIPAGLALLGGFGMLALKLEFGKNFISDEALMMLALACYILAALFQLTNLYAPSEMARKIGVSMATLGVFFNLSSWLVRWVAAYEREIDMLRSAGNPATPWMFRYVPFANLYDLSLAFAFGAGFATLLFTNRKNFQILSAFTLPLAAIILTLARFIGGEFIDLPPVLDSYWRPIHVGVASLSYGVTLVCFAVAVLYLLKDKVKPEAMAVWASLFAIAVIGSISNFSVFTQAVYRVGLFLPNESGGKALSGFFRVPLPYVAPFLLLTTILLLGVVGFYLAYIYKNYETGKKIGGILLKIAFVTLLIGVAFIVSDVKTINSPGKALQSELAQNPQQFVLVGKEIMSKQNMPARQFAAITPAQFEQTGRQFFENNSSKFYLSVNTNPVELSGLITALAGLFFVILFSYRTDYLIARLPSLEALDNLMYTTACLAFAGLAMLLITGAIWANESWGRPWGFDSKETGALIAWLTYAAFLHTRISRGWKGRSSAYFAIIGFLFVIFTYLGVSYLLPGLHSYA